MTRRNFEAPISLEDTSQERKNFKALLGKHYGTLSRKRINRYAKKYHRVGWWD